MTKHITPPNAAQPLVTLGAGTPATTMSSLEIAELTGKEHRHVLADIRRTLTELGIHCAEFSAQYRDPTGRMLPCFDLPHRECMVLVSGYDVPLRARIIDRWMQLERRVFDPSDPAVLLAVMGSLQAQVAAKDVRIAELEPQAATLKQLTGSPGSINMTDAAKVLGLRRKDFFVWLSVNDWTFRGPDGKWRSNAEKIAAGLLEQIIQTFGDDNQYTTVSVRITVSGMAELDHLIDRALFAKVKRTKAKKVTGPSKDGALLTDLDGETA